MRKIILLLVVLMGMCSVAMVWGLAQYEDDPSINRDTFGKVIGQIIDPETGKPVNEKFRVCIFNWYRAEIDYDLRKDCSFYSDDKGHINLDLPPATYGFLFNPQKQDTKYAVMYHPFYYKMPQAYKEMFSCKIKVETGQITRFVKKAIIGGALKVTLVDLAGNPVDPAIAFPGRSVIISA